MSGVGDLHIPPTAGPTTPPSVWGSGCALSSKALISLQVFHQSVGWFASGLKCLTGSKLDCTRVVGHGDGVLAVSTSEPCGQRCHPGDSVRLLEDPPPSSLLLPPPSSPPPPPFCSPALLIENVFIAGPEAGLGRGRCCSL